MASNSGYHPQHAQCYVFSFRVQVKAAGTEGDLSLWRKASGVADYPY